jgi:deoxyribodipyrimidine photo-lyase
MSEEKDTVSIFWFRRDLRLDDNAGLYNALKRGGPVLPLFIFDTEILDELEEKNDVRVQFIYDNVIELRQELQQHGSTLLVKHGKPVEVWKALLQDYNIATVYTNEDYEPYAIHRDEQIRRLLDKSGIEFRYYKDQVIFHKDEVVKDDGKPYTVFTPYSKKWKAKLQSDDFYLKSYPVKKYLRHLFKTKDHAAIPSLKSLGFVESDILIPTTTVPKDLIVHYNKTRDLPALEHGTTRLGIHLRFGTMSIRQLAAKAKEWNEVFLGELIWREFFMMILYHFPRVVSESFRKEYDKIDWLNDEKQFQLWCEGKTGYPLVDAGIRQMNATGFMHNRVRMVVASFLTRHLLIDWRWGEAYFAKKLLDYELASNNGNWQWAAGTGCDAAPYFRIFNPEEQMKRFDKEHKYIKRWVPEYGTSAYPEPIVDHKMARARALAAYKKALG